MDLGIIFLTGLTIGGVSCMAVQGGLLASLIASREEEDLQSGQNKKHTIWPVVAFLAAKLVAYLILGFLLGAFGGALQISEQIRTIMQLLAGLYMLAVAGNLLNIHPIFRYVIISPPRFLMRMVKNKSKSKDLFAPMTLGFMTILIPCGTTIAMEALAISSGSALSGAAILGTFVLGTTPLFFALGFLTTTLGDAFSKNFLKIAAVLVLYLGASSVNGSLIALGSPLALQSMWEVIPIEINLGEGSGGGASVGQIINGVQNFDIRIVRSGYDPSYIKVKKGEPVKLNLISEGVYSCALAFRIPSLGIAKNLKPTGTDFVEFTPTQAGKIAYTCSMGMYSGTIDVVD